MTCAFLLSPLYPILLQAVASLATLTPKNPPILYAKALLVSEGADLAAEWLTRKYGIRKAVELIMTEEEE